MSITILRGWFQSVWLRGALRLQVEVGIRTEKSFYLAGEPVFILVDIRNLGDEAISYDGGAIVNPLFVVVNGTRKQVRSLSPCGGMGSGGAMGITDHPPMLKPGAQNDAPLFAAWVSPHAGVVRRACGRTRRRALEVLSEPPEWRASAATTT